MRVSADLIVTLRVTGTTVQVAPHSPYVRALHDAFIGDIPLGMFSHEVQRIALDELEREGRKLLAGRDPINDGAGS